MFTGSLAYCTNTQKVVTKAGEHCSSACLRCEAIGAPIADEAAPLRALGLLDPDNQPCDLPEVNNGMDNWTMDSALTEDMLEGATLPPLPWPIDFRPTIAVLRAWLSTRAGMTMQSSSTRAQIVKVVQARIQLETDMKARGEAVLLRDPRGISMHRHLQQMNPQALWHFPSEQGTSGTLPQDGWLQGREQVATQAPFIEKQVIFHHWERFLTNVGDDTRNIIDDAYSRVLEMNNLIGFGYHPNTTAVMPRTRHGGNQKSVYFRMRVPASQQMAQAYSCWIECLTAKFRGSHPFVTKICGGGCQCPVGSSTQCVHVCMCAIVVHLFPRPQEINGGKAMPVTSFLCAWADPGGGDTFDVTTPLANIPFIRVRMKTRQNKAIQQCSDSASQGSGCVGSSSTTRRLLQVCVYLDSYNLMLTDDPRMQVSDNAGWRNKFIALADKDFETLDSTRSDPRRVAKRHALWRAIRQAQGTASAAETAFRCLDPEVPQDPYNIMESDSSSSWETQSTTSTECSGQWTDTSQSASSGDEEEGDCLHL